MQNLQYNFADFFRVQFN